MQKKCFLNLISCTFFNLKGNNPDFKQFVFFSGLTLRSLKPNILNFFKFTIKQIQGIASFFAHFQKILISQQFLKNL